MNSVDLYTELHRKDTTYGATGVKYFNEACTFIDNFDGVVKTVLDYGCGKGALIKRLAKTYPEIKFYGYDPCVDGYTTLPDVKHFDLVLCTDVLEHVPLLEIDDVVKEISGLSQYVMFALDHCKAYAELPDGTNAHCTIKPISWYVSKFDKHFNELTVLECREKFKHIVLTYGIRPHVYDEYYGLCVYASPHYARHNRSL